MAEEKINKLQDKTPKDAANDEAYDFSDTVDTRMFNEQELNQISDSLISFLQQKKSSQQSLNQNLQAGKKPQKRNAIIPLILLTVSTIVGILALQSYFIGDIANNENITRLFGSSLTNSDEVDQNTELILEVRNESERNLVQVVVNAVNLENAVSQENAVENSGTNTDSAKQEEITAELIRARETLSAQVESTTAANSEVNAELARIQENYTLLSKTYEFANLQLDQYIALVRKIRQSLIAQNYPNTRASLNQLDSFLISDSLQGNPYFQNIKTPGTLYSQTVKDYLVIVEQADQRSSAATEQAEESSNAAREALQQLQEKNDDLLSEITTAQKGNRDLQQENNTLNQTITELTAKIDILNNEIIRARQQIQ